MLGLGSTLTKPGKIGLPIVTDNLVLHHKYIGGEVHQVSTGAAFFNGSSDFIQLPFAFRNASNKITISAWYFNTTDSGTKAIFENRNNSVGTTRGILFYVASTERLTVKCQDTSINGNIMPVNEWIHACMTYDPSLDSQNLKLYENGILVATANLTTDLDDTVWSDARIGRGNVTGGDYYFTGYICNVGVWDKELSQAEVKSIMWKNYADLTSGETANLVSWYNLDSAIDSTDVGYGALTVYDNHHGGGDTLGSNLVTGNDSTFSGTSSNWVVFVESPSTVALSYDEEKMIVTVDGQTSLDAAGARLEISSSLTAGKTYQVQWDMWRGTFPDVDNWRVQLGGTTVVATSSLSTTRTTYTVYVTTTNTNDLYFYNGDVDPTDDGTFFIDNVSVKLVNGNTGTLS